MRNAINVGFGAGPDLVARWEHLAHKVLDLPRRLVVRHQPHAYADTGEQRVGLDLNDCPAGSRLTGERNPCCHQWFQPFQNLLPSYSYVIVSIKDDSQPNAACRPHFLTDRIKDLAIALHVYYFKLRHGRVLSAEMRHHVIVIFAFH